MGKLTISMAIFNSIFNGKNIVDHFSQRGFLMGGSTYLFLCLAQGMGMSSKSGSDRRSSVPAAAGGKPWLDGCTLVQFLVGNKNFEVCLAHSHINTCQKWVKGLSSSEFVGGWQVILWVILALSTAAGQSVETLEVDMWADEFVWPKSLPNRCLTTDSTETTLGI